ncbi:MAG TPA: TetR/AcrR family transcriptional regulator [Candidatus Limnocylindria bacterium]|jgi:AcrR family transcriptional regulator
MAPRTLNPNTHAVKRDAFVDVAQRMIATRGYEQMTIQDVLDELDTSRGAFYHYFDSKSALLGEVIERMAEAAVGLIRPVAADPELRAPEKLERIFGTIANFKSERADLILAILEIWRSDENAIVREKLRRRLAAIMGPILTDVVRQGKAEGTFDVSSPEETAIAAVWLMQGAQERAMDLYLARQAGTISYDEVVDAFAGYTTSMERVLGAAPHALTLAQPSVLRRWFA